MTAGRGGGGRPEWVFESVRSCLIDKLIWGGKRAKKGECSDSLTGSSRKKKLVAAGFEDL